MKIADASTSDKSFLTQRLILIYWSPVLIWAWNIFLLSSSDHPVKALESYYVVPMKADIFGHFFEFTVFGFLLARALTHARPSWVKASLWGSVTLIGAAYGFFDEWHQAFVPGRSASFSDWANDILFSLVGTIFFVLFTRIRWNRLLRKSVGLKVEGST